MPGYVTGAERAAGVGEPEGGSLRPGGLALRSWRGARGYLEPRPPSRRAPREAAGHCPGARAGPQPAAAALRSWTLETGGGLSPAPGIPSPGPERFPSLTFYPDLDPAVRLFLGLKWKLRAQRREAVD